MHLNLLILFAILSPAIIGTISTENINESTGLVRKKRVINTAPGEDVPVNVGEYTYIVKIMLHNKLHCVGSILSSYTVITSASCASQPTHISGYKILTGSIYNNGGMSRNVIDKKIRFGNYGGTRNLDGIALFIVNANLLGFRFTSSIRLHSEPIMPNVMSGRLATVVGWGCYYVPGFRGTVHPKLMRAITVPIIPHRDCVNILRRHINITDEDICVWDEHRHCGNTDGGAPLIIEGRLAGIYLRRGPFTLPAEVPEIFSLLQHDHYNQWIANNIEHPHN